MSSEIRLATREDLENIVGVFFACWQESYRDLLPVKVREEMTLEKARELWLPSLGTTSDRVTLLLLTEGFVVGVARCGRDVTDTGRGHLFSLYIHPKYAGKGFGKALLGSVLEELTEKGLIDISLWVFKENENAQGLYRKAGFSPTGVERTDDRWRIPEIEMVRNGTNLRN
jgi:ribosomal protein S18 acetylase RimI-like enzyme